ncbi:hypothetical protein LTS07_008004 [Exophiala sideris]|uniref:BZIP domain-containing protein n=1 Tax=Exophiala sideris TaxID=1016849 RepID=A0ABR0JFI4_9EURO|nr:hypothetical protein LTS07_008004 [Exophiala sideris]KAK5032992.1 hypothetical protein LTR13_006957 [Exophiala sideris]KAK5063477.1 hypothetical protein LTR69_004183 [Exophiala sideris]KAK5180691.1 hypothetical protein LTR44_007005 [Eurotiomycetes sp. CCFEE 6388]
MASQTFTHDLNLWQFPMPPNYTSPESVTFDNSSTMFNFQDLLSGSTGDASSITLPDAGPQFVQLQELHSSPTVSPVSKSPPSRRGSLDLGGHGPLDTMPEYLSLDRRRAIRRLSLATSDLSSEAYRPRNTPARPRKSSSSRITPRSDKHARELELNRKAATKCRNRQKSFIENLQARCKKEEEKMHIQTSLVHALHDEVLALRNEVMRQSFCDCQFMKGAPALMA